MAEGTAVGYNKKKKGQRSYYPLFCAVAQTGQVLDVWHRPGNVHDSNGARHFILKCIEEIRRILPNTTIEVRMDSAFFSEEIVAPLEALSVHYTIPVPFERLTELKRIVERRKWWHGSGKDTSYFELNWKPQRWAEHARFVVIRTREPRQRKGPLQLCLLDPYEYRHWFKVILTNSTLLAQNILALHNRRGAQEALFAELKSQTNMDYVPCNRRAGNEIWLLSAVLARNLNRELHMSTHRAPISLSRQMCCVTWRPLRSENSEFTDAFSET